MPPAPAAYHPSVPLHHQIQRVLRSKIESGGSFVASACPAPTQAGRVTNLLLGYAAEIRVVAAETAPAPVHVTPWLQAERGERVKRFVRIEIVDGSPLAVVVNYMREALGHRIRPRDLTRLSMLELLRDRLRIPLGVIREQIEARLPDDEVASLLGIDLTQPVLVLRLIVSDADGRCLQVSDGFYRADRYRYEMDARLPSRRRRRSRRRSTLQKRRSQA